ncbi:MAG: hypothetical protein KAF91_12955 [Nostoc sp. TH1S01]|nr:hypothetical protein [Nostoc sp. TH1S01]
MLSVSSKIFLQLINNLLQLGKLTLEFPISQDSLRKAIAPLALPYGFNLPSLGI